MDNTTTPSDDTPAPPLSAAATPGDGPDNPHRLANGFLQSVVQSPSSGLICWRDEFLRYQGGAYRPVPDGDQRGELTKWIRDEFLRLHAADLSAWLATDEKLRGRAPTVRPVTTGLVGNVLQALGSVCLLPAGIDPPAWINGASGPDPARLVPLRNGLLDPSADSGSLLLPATPGYFCTAAAPVEYVPGSSVPAEWLRFLEQIWPADPDSRAALQEWFGYLLTPDTKQQRILLLLGPPRAGKGTITRMLRELVGPGNVAGPTLAGLTTNFGLSNLLGKSVAVIADARLSGRQDAAVAVERLLAISGEDLLTVDRKFREPVTVKLNTRFVIVSNELPKLPDASGALARRFFPLRLDRSWLGKEDVMLFDRLRAELPGILLWAIDGWRRLRERGRFVQPRSAAELVEELEDLGSPASVFVRERCVVAPGQRVEVSELYQEWRHWCALTGQKDAGNEATFGRDLRAAYPSVGKARPRTSEGRLHVYTGIGLRGDAADSRDDEAGPGHSGHSGHGNPPMHAGGSQERTEAQRAPPYRE